MFLQVKSTDIYRMKGVVDVKGESNKIVFQGVHMMLSSQVGKPWGDEQPVNRMVFIGKDLDEGYIQRSLKTCLN
jgi:G3E family GTPase